MSQITIGLSGHIDHGKTSIVKSLTGKNTDNLKDEIKRGMTIDIGFAHLNEKISLIDVPGHEKFIKNMVAGVSAIDSVILVIAADDGIMPQTKEHFQILKLLGIDSGIIVINKIDLVDKEWLDLIELEIKEFVNDTFLHQAKIIKISTILNEGLETLKKEIINISTNKKNKFNRDIFRMFIDRVFTKKGFGTVVTGTISSGKIKKDQQIEILPNYEKANIRGIHTHDNNAEILEIGDRGAINLQSINKINLKRGFHLGEIDYFNLVDNAVCNISTFKELKHNQRIRIHLGTQEVMARVYFPNDKIKSSMIVLLKFENQIIAAFKDKFIIRTFSPVATIGGGEIIDINLEGKWNQNKIYINGFLDEKIEHKIIEKIIQRNDKMVFTKTKLSKHLSLSINILDKLLNKIKNLIYFSSKNPWIITLNQYETYSKNIIDILKSFHKKNPYNKGFLIDEINNKMLLPDNLLRFILLDLCDNKKVKVESDLYSKYDFKINLSKDNLMISEKLLDILDKELFQTSNITDLADKLKQNENTIKKLLQIEKSNNNIIIINGEILFTSENYNKLLEKIDKFFKNNSSLNIKDFKEITNTSRKYAVPLLEYLDKQKITYRLGNERKYNKK